MTLKDKLDLIRAGAATRMPAAALATMAAATQNLRASGILRAVLGVGATLPPFALPNARGDVIRSSQLLDRGAVVLTVFRGHW
jgi:hypothetical protein